MIFFAIFFVIFLIVLIFFAFPKLSPIPYFPSNKKDALLIIKALGLKNNQQVFDLGAGDGWVVFEAANVALKRKFNTQFIALEINPILYVVLLLRRLRHKNKKNIKIVWGDMFTLDYKKYFSPYKSDLVYYIYISPWLIEKIAQSIQKLKKQFTIISYMYQIPRRREVQKLVGRHNVYKYNYA